MEAASNCRSRLASTHPAECPALEAYGATLIPKTNAFIAAYDEARKSETNWKKEMKEGKGAIAPLVKLMRAWLPSFTRDIPGFSSSDFADKPDVPDDVLADATRLFDAESGANAPSWKASFETNVTPAFTAAVKEWQEAEAADSTYQKLLKGVRDAAGVLDSELQLYRVTLGAVAGTNDKDYQKLRAEKASAKDEEDSTPLAGGDGAGTPTPSGPPPN